MMNAESLEERNRYLVLRDKKDKKRKNVLNFNY